MTKIAIITDLHFGVRKDDPFFLQKQVEWWNNEFMPVLKANNIRTVLHLGDFFDNRKSINLETAYIAIGLLNKLHENLDVSIITNIGNHDTYYKNTNKVNSVELLLSQQFSHIVKDSVEKFTFPNNKTFYLVGWICEENQEQILAQMASIPLEERTQAYLAGHFEIAGIPVGNRIIEHGMEQSIFHGWKRVLSGHYHIPSVTNNIHYIGNPFYHTWNDYNTTRGFYVYDCEKDEFIHHHTKDIVYHVMDLDSIKQINHDDYHNQIIRINVDNLKDNQESLNEIVAKLNLNNNRTEVIDVSTMKEDIDLTILDSSSQKVVEISSKEFMADMVNEIGVDDEIKSDVIDTLSNLLVEVK